MSNLRLALPRKNQPKRERPGQNPFTGDAVMITPKRVVTFKRSGKLKEKINCRWTKMI
ncbi:HU family DNA-binding protein [Thermodesulfobacteriota bacterium]